MNKNPPSSEIKDISLFAKSLFSDKSKLELVQERVDNSEGVFLANYSPSVKGKCYILVDPDMLEELFKSKHVKKPVKGECYRDVRFTMRNGLLTSGEKIWNDQILSTKPEFLRNKIKDLVPIFERISDKHTKKWYSDGYIDLERAMKKFSIEIVANSIFSEDILKYDDKIISSTDAIRNNFKKRTERLIKNPLYLPTKTTMENRKAKRNLQKISREIVLNRQKNPDKYDDIFSKIMKLSESLSEGETNETRLQDQAVTFLQTSYETTASALTWTFFLLSKNNKIQRNASEEARNNTFEDHGKDIIENLDYNKKVFKESLRMYSPVPVVYREAKKDISVNGYRLRKEIPILISPYLVHRTSNNWKRPNLFNPKRFDENYHEYSFIPFSKGKRSCIGKHMAIIESLTMLQKTLQDYEVNIKKPNKPVGLDVGISLTPKRTIKFNLNKE